MKFNGASFIITEDCNLRCKYCFTEKSKKVMSEKVAMDAIDFLIRSIKSNKDKVLKIDLFGGEPTLEVPILKTILNYGLKRTQEEGIKFDLKLITNATIFTEEYNSFLKEWKEKMGKVNIQLSIDGIPEIQDENRISLDKNIKSSEIVENTVNKYKKLAEEININIGEELHPHSVTSKASLSHIFENYLYIRNLGFYGLWNVLVQEENWDDSDIATYRQELMKLADYFIENKDHSLWQGYTLFAKNRNEHPERPCGAGYTYCSITTEGDVYPCHRFYFADKKTKLGSIYDETIDEEQLMFYESISTDKLIGDKTCTDCKNKGCYKCIAAFYEENKIPYLGFSKYCKMVNVETEVRNYLYDKLGISQEKESCSTCNTETNANIEQIEKILNNIAIPMAETIDKTLASNNLVANEINNIKEVLEDMNKAIIALSTLTISILEKLTGADFKND